MSEILILILRIVIIVITPIIGLLLAKAAQATATYFGVKSDDSLIRYYREEVDRAVETAVKFANQKYVDALKKAGEFGTKEKQDEAMSIAKSQALLQLSDDTKEYLQKTYGSIDLYMLGRLEAQVGDQKKEKLRSEQSVTLALPAVAELESIPDTTTIAASTAAATAATVAQVAINQYSSQTPPAE